MSLAHLSVQPIMMKLAEKTHVGFVLTKRVVTQVSNSENNFRNFFFGAAKKALALAFCETGIMEPMSHRVVLHATATLLATVFCSQQNALANLRPYLGIIAVITGHVIPHTLSV